MRTLYVVTSHTIPRGYSDTLVAASRSDVVKSITTLEVMFTFAYTDIYVALGVDLVLQIT
jgi:hypothetical protein